MNSSVKAVKAKLEENNLVSDIRIELGGSGHYKVFFTYLGRKGLVVISNSPSDAKRDKNNSLRYIKREYERIHELLRKV